MLQQELSEFFTFMDQCCDANKYLHLGELCAETGDCYHHLRPMGAIYWFSIPFRLGLPVAATLISANLLLLVISVLLATFALLKLQRLSVLSVSRMTSLVILLASACIHLVFLYPLLRVSLSDAPASLLMLIAIWLLLISCAQKTPGFIMCALIGLCFGLAAWLRIFFLYPVLLATCAGLLILWPKHKLAAAGLLLALLPITMQLFATWSHTGSCSYVNPDSSRTMTTWHINDRRSGYDTLLTDELRYNWYSPCRKYLGLIDAIDAGDIRSLRCLLSARLDFYLGSYSARTYPHSGVAGEFRVWSVWLLAANSVAGIGAVLFFIALRKKLQLLQWLAPLVLLLSAGMALVIIPEQRFAMVPIILIWFFCFAGLLLLLTGKRKSRL
jgi:hypothetical protein